MQRVSSLLPSWERRTSTSGANTGSAASTTTTTTTTTTTATTTTASTPTTSVSGSNNGQRVVSTGGFFGWPTRSSSKSSSLSKINIAAANRHSNSLSIKSAAAPARVQREAFWPATLDLECEKAARIIKSFCADGYLGPIVDEPSTPASPDEPKTPIKVSKKIPRQIIQNAAGIAVFTCMRNGLWMTGSGGSGILIARKSDGTWSPPSGIMLHTPTLSFIIGVDVYDCVLVVNSLAALESITRSKVTLGEDVGLTYGTTVAQDSRDTEINVRDLGNTVMTYVKGRGQEQRVNLNGCILTERANENERFYGPDVSQMEILSGTVSRYVEETQSLFEVIKMAEGRIDFDAAMIAKIAVEPAPGDALIASPKSTPQSPRRGFGMPNMDDPDPFGILALEMAGMEIREAGTRVRPTSGQLDFHPKRVSSLSKVQRQSGETFINKSNRESYMSTRTMKSQVTDAGTQTNRNTPDTSPSPGQSEDGQAPGQIEIDETVEANHENRKDDEVDYTTIDLSVLDHIRQPEIGKEKTPSELNVPNAIDSTRLGPPSASDDIERASKASSVYGDASDIDAEGDKADVVTEDADDEDDDEFDDDDDDDEEEPVIFEVATVQPARTQAVVSRVVQAKGNVVTIPKRIPPPLPARNPARASTASRSDAGDMSNLPSPMRRNFSDSELAADDKTKDASAAPRSESAAEVTRRDSAQFEPLLISVSGADESALKTPKDSKSLEASLEPSNAQTSPDDAKQRNTQDSANEKEARVHEPITIIQTSDEAEDKPDSPAKSRLSVDTGATGATDDQSSLGGSSYTTPTSERRFSFGGDYVNDDTPKRNDSGISEPTVVIDTPKKFESSKSERIALAEKANDNSLVTESVPAKSLAT